VFVLLPSVTKDSIIRRSWQKTQSKCARTITKIRQDGSLGPWGVSVSLECVEPCRGSFSLPCSLNFHAKKRMESTTVLTSDAWKTKLLTSQSYNARFYSLMSLLVYRWVPVRCDGSKKIIWNIYKLSRYYMSPLQHTCTDL
jgi:hypothetical protein